MNSYCSPNEGGRGDKTQHLCTQSQVSIACVHFPSPCTPPRPPQSHILSAHCHSMVLLCVFEHLRPTPGSSVFDHQLWRNNELPGSLTKLPYLDPPVAIVHTWQLMRDRENKGKSKPKSQVPEAMPLRRRWGAEATWKAITTQALCVWCLWLHNNLIFKYLAKWRTAGTERRALSLRKNNQDSKPWLPAVFRL